MKINDANEEGRDGVHAADAGGADGAAGQVAVRRVRREPPGGAARLLRAALLEIRATAAVEEPVNHADGVDAADAGGADGAAGQGGGSAGAAVNATDPWSREVRRRLVGPGEDPVHGCANASGGCVAPGRPVEEWRRQLIADCNAEVDKEMAEELEVERQRMAQEDKEARERQRMEAVMAVTAKMASTLEARRKMAAEVDAEVDAELAAPAGVGRGRDGGDGAAAAGEGDGGASVVSVGGGRSAEAVQRLIVEACWRGAEYGGRTASATIAGGGRVPPCFELPSPPLQQRPSPELAGLLADRARLVSLLGDKTLLAELESSRSEIQGYGPKASRGALKLQVDLLRLEVLQRGAGAVREEPFSSSSASSSSSSSPAPFSAPEEPCG